MLFLRKVQAEMLVRQYTVKSYFEGKIQINVIAKEAFCSQGAVCKHINAMLSVKEKKKSCHINIS